MNKFKIKNNFLEPSNRKYLTSKFSQGRNICDFIVLHYTGSYKGVKGDLNTCLDTNVKASWHLTVDRDGRIYQHADFRKITWHAGKSKWNSSVTGKTYNGMNRFSIGIEMDNAGKLQKRNGKFFTSWGHEVSEDHVFSDFDGIHWEKYTDKQLKTVANVCKVLKDKYNIQEILGHSDVSPNRKIDPGSAFDMEKLRSEVFNTIPV